MGPAPNLDATTIPKLMPNGANWVSFKRRMFIDIGSRPLLLRHLEGHAPYPKLPPPLKSKPTQQEQDEYDERREKYENAVDLWRTHDFAVQRQIVHNIPDSIFIRIQNLSTAAEMWDALRRDFEGRNQIVQNELRNRLALAKCGENENVREHVDRMRYMHEELSGMGVTIADGEYVAMLTKSMPKSYGHFFAAILAATHASGNSLMPSAVMDYAVSEFDRRQIENAPKQRGSTTGDTALYTFATDPGRSGRRGRRKAKGDDTRKCFNCGEAGHLKRNCQKPKQEGDKAKESGNGNANKGASTGTSKAPLPSASIAEVKEPTPPPRDVYSAAAFTGYAGETRGAIFDSGCTAHVSPYRELFTNYTPIDSIPITAANKTYFQAIGRGDVEVALPNGRDTTRMILRNVLHCPGIAFTLVSMSVMDRAGYSFTLKDSWLSVIAPNGTKIADIPLENGLYRIPVQGHVASIAAGGELTVRIDELHRRLGHLGVDACRDAVRRGMVDGVKLVDANAPAINCEPCARSKAAEKSFPKESPTPRVVEYGGRIHSDVWGHAPVKSLGGREYMLTFTDEHTREVTVYFMAKKSDTFEAYKLFEAWVSTHRQAKIKILRTDRGGEYLSNAFKKYLETNGTHHELTVHHSPSQNGVSERLNKTLVLRARACLIETDLPGYLWAEALQYAVWTKNRTPTRTLKDKTPLEMATGSRPDLRDIHAWGTKGYVRVEGRGKLEPQADPAFFVGYDHQSKGYRMYWPNKRSISTERNVQWADRGPAQLEGEKHTSVNQAEPRDPINPITQNPAPPISQDAVLPTGLQTRRAANAAVAFDSAAPWDLGTSVLDCCAAYWALSGEIIREPRNPKDAKTLPQWPQWLSAMEEEMRRIDELGTWELVLMPSESNVVGCKWVYKVKRDQKGDVSRYKARLVAQGFTQVPGVDYVDTFAPVAKFSTLRVLLALAASCDWEIHQMDVKNAYLNGKLTETIYMKQPPEFVDPEKPKHVCRLARGLYGLRQSGRVWYQTLAKAFKALGFDVCAVDHAVFVSHKPEPKVIVAASTDDLLMISECLKRLEAVKRGLENHFEMTDLGEAHWLLGVEIRRDRAKRTLSLSQGAYVQTVLGRFNLENANTVTSPMDPSVHLTKSQSPATDEEKEDMASVPYRELIGSLMYAAVATRPDIAHAVTALSQFLENPGHAHWQAAQRVVKYLKGTGDFGLTYGLADGVGMPAGKPVGYTDADFASQEHRHSVSGYAFLVHGGAVSWSSKTQAVIALSSTEAEYIASMLRTVQIICPTWTGFEQRFTEDQVKQRWR